MSNAGPPKPAIPAWQRAAQPRRPAATEDPVYSQPEDDKTHRLDSAAEESETAEAETSDEPQSVPSDDTSPTTTPTAETELKECVAFAADDFASFKQQQQQPRQEAAPPPPQQRPTAPPIITYPEFLVEAHKPPPLITPTRILNSVYVAGGIAAILYGASKWIINPMVDSLSESRHDFLNHSQSKVDEFNERLSKIVTKIPEPKRADHIAEMDVDEAESDTSDPTELYHRDMGTQTSPLPSRRPSLPDASAEQKKDPVTYQTGALEIIREHLNEISEGVAKNSETNKDGQDTINKLRHYLDGLIYGTSPSLWQTSEDAIAMKSEPILKDDTIEELKKEIRGVKGVLLSAKRFPAVSRPIPGAA